MTQQQPKNFIERLQGWLGPIDRWLVRRAGARRAAAVEIFSITFATIFLAGFLLTLTIQPKYTAMAIIGPQSSPQDDPTGGGIAGGFNSLGSLLGGTGLSPNMQAFQALVGTASFADYVMKHDHLARIFYPAGVHHGLLSTSLHTLFRQPFAKEVTVTDVQAALQTGVLVQQRTLTPYLEVYYTSKNRDDAIRVVSAVLHSADQVLRSREAQGLNTQIDYLSKAMAETTDVTRLDTFRNLLGKKLAAKVLIETQDTYSFKIFDAPSAPMVPNSPKIAILIALLFVAGLMFGLAAGVGWLWWSSRSEP